jgi:hypothetical protein
MRTHQQTESPTGENIVNDVLFCYLRSLFAFRHLSRAYRRKTIIFIKIEVVSLILNLPLNSSRAELLSGETNIDFSEISHKTMDNSQLLSLCYCLFLQITFINTKSQLFTLKNNKIVMFNANIESIDEIFQIISSKDGMKNGNLWVKEKDNYEFAFDTE